MSQSTKFLIAIIAAGILIGAAVKTTTISAGIMPSNFALAQPFRLPFQTHVLIQAPLQQQPLAKGSSGVPKQITVQYVVNKVDISGAVFVASAADCSTGTILTGGGYFEHSSSTTDFKIVQDRPGVFPGPPPVAQWQVSGYSPSKTPEPRGASLELYAVCVS